MPLSNSSATSRSRSDSWAAAGKQVIPTVSAGWDPRPRVTYPCTYGSAENCSCPWGGAGGERYVVDPTMEELTAHTTAGLDWVAKNNGEGGAAEASAMLLSAWNEHDEGHWIQPALAKYGGTEKLDAIKKAAAGTWRATASMAAPAPPTPRLQLERELAVETGEQMGFAGELPRKKPTPGRQNEPQLGDVACEVKLPSQASYDDAETTPPRRWVLPEDRQQIAPGNPLTTADKHTQARA